MSLNNRRNTPFFFKWLYYQGICERHRPVSSGQLTSLSEDFIMTEARAGLWGFSRASHSSLLGKNAQTKVSLAIVNSDEDRDPLINHTSPYYRAFSTSPMTSHQMDQLLGSVIEMWVDRMDNITQPERRKLSALALLSLLPSDNRWEHFHYWLLVQIPCINEFSFCFYFSFFISVWWCTIKDFPPTCL